MQVTSPRVHSIIICILATILFTLSVICKVLCLS
uniref:Uncharacterized protein n=1 Tax=Anguilla anguilla TaxID=7936 RepID=A0A0E9SMM8_ANGAN